MLNFSRFSFGITSTFEFVPDASVGFQSPKLAVIVPKLTDRYKRDLLLSVISRASRLAAHKGLEPFLPD